MFAQSGDLGLEFGDERLDQVFVAEQNVLEAREDAVFKFGSLDADATVAGATFALGRAVIALPVALSE